MATLEIHLAPDEHALLERQAAQKGLSLSDWARQTLLGLPEPAAFITDDGGVFPILDLPDKSGIATYLASETAFTRLWNAPQEVTFLL